MSTIVGTAVKAAGKTANRLSEKVWFIKDILANPDAFKIELYFEGETLVLKVRRKAKKSQLSMDC